MRLEQIRTRAHATHRDGSDQSLLRAAQAHNLAALTASDCGLPTLAQELCTRQATLFLKARPFDAATAKLALQPLINIGRLLIRDGRGAVAHRLFEQLYTAAKSQTDRVVDGFTVTFQDLTASAEDHREITKWLWSVLLADGTRALAQAGRWPEALHHARQHKAIGQRLLDGRQITVLAHSTAGEHDQALTLLAASDTPTPWEEAVAATLTLLCRSRAGQAIGPGLTDLVDRYLTGNDDSEHEHAAFRARLGLCAVDLAGDTKACQRVVSMLANEAREHADAYVARDLLAHRSCAGHLDANTAWPLRTIAYDAGLGRGSLPPNFHDDLMESIQLSEAALRFALQKPSTSLGDYHGIATEPGP
ncbi:hypothetical protein GPA10_40005 [Streptomyces sp. p1417]|uniref:Uncharacterized protein n=1 Tax=Streptomyces typhae TaxID=2681492 RepID=A0A6L6X9Y1_9ACTN|nr:hypothetical protein [Streptomyces typhae]MVO90765.1 hypothetical protein [Streptomyces typhae]